MSDFTPSPPLPKRTSIMPSMLPATDPPLRTFHSENGWMLGYTDENPSFGVSSIPVVALHGSPGSVRDYRYLGALVAKSCRFIRIEYPGYGDLIDTLTAENKTFSFARDDFVKVTAAILNHLEIQQCVLVGCSFGNAVATAFASRYPEKVAGMVFLASPGLRPHRFQRQLSRIPIPPRFIAMSVNWPIIGPFLVRLAYPKMRAAFPKITEKETAVMLRLGNSGPFENHVKSLRSLPPFLKAFIWARNDAIVENAVSEELSSSIFKQDCEAFAQSLAVSPHKNKNNNTTTGTDYWCRLSLQEYRQLQQSFILQLETGGHNLLKPHANLIANTIIRLVQSIESLQKGSDITSSNPIPPISMQSKL